MVLSKKQIKHLKGIAHYLKPVVMTGQNGLTDNVKAEIALALSQHELIKVKLGGFERSEKQSVIQTICDELSAEAIHSIGHMAVFFKRNPEKPRIELPKF